MARIFLVDSENIGSMWVRLLPVVTDEDKMYVYYTEHSPYVSYEHLIQIIAFHNIPNFVKCYEGKNALDFQLVSELGYKLSQFPDVEFVVVSDDLGYDAAVRYWMEKGFHIRRIGKKLCRPATFQRMDIVQNEEAVLVEEAPEDQDINETSLEPIAQGGAEESPEVSVENETADLKNQILAIVKKCGSSQTELDANSVQELFCTLKMNKLTEVNTALKILIGNDLGNDIYRELKEHSEYRAQLDALYYPTPKERFIHYVKIVLDRSNLKDMEKEELGEFLLNIPRKNLNSIRSAMLKQYGHEQGSEIYTLFKSHIKVLNKI